MTETSTSKPWDLTNVIDLLHAFSTSKSPAEAQPDPFLNAILDCRKTPETSYTSSGLGDFSQIWEYRGIDLPDFIDSPDGTEPPDDIEINPESYESASSFASSGFSSDHISFSSPATDDVPTDEAEAFEDYVTNDAVKEVRWKDEIPAIDLPPLKRNLSGTTAPSPIVADRIFNIQSPSKKTRGNRSRLRSSDAVEPSGFESEADLNTRRISRRQLISSSSLGYQYPISQTFDPVYDFTVEEKQKRLNRKISKKFEIDERFLARPMSRLGTVVDEDAIHVFVDCSNIVVGFCEALKIARSIPKQSYMTAPLCFRSLASILERNRPVARRVLVGSTASNARRPDHFSEAEKCGYEVDILDRVYKARSPNFNKLKGGRGNGYLAGASSGSETPYSDPTMGFVEQGVDELIHLKMMESLVDGMSKKPSTMVLASGDGAEAEYSGGFFKMVERALKLGWKVEIVAWKKGLSFEYKSEEFRRSWRKQFSIIELDDFSEELLGFYKMGL